MQFNLLIEKINGGSDRFTTPVSDGDTISITIVDENGRQYHRHFECKPCILNTPKETNP